jgi:hypothetical protein
MITSVRASRVIWMNSLRIIDTRREFMRSP